MLVPLVQLLYLYFSTFPLRFEIRNDPIALHAIHLSNVVTPHMSDNDDSSGLSPSAHSPDLDNNSNSSSIQPEHADLATVMTTDQRILNNLVRCPLPGRDPRLPPVYRYSEGCHPKLNYDGVGTSYICLFDSSKAGKLAFNPHASIPARHVSDGDAKIDTAGPQPMPRPSDRPINSRKFRPSDIQTILMYLQPRTFSRCRVK